MSTLDDARAWAAAAVDAHERGEWSRAAAAARIGTMLAGIAHTEHLMGPGAAPDADRPSLAPVHGRAASRIRTIHEVAGSHPVLRVDDLAPPAPATPEPRRPRP